MNTKTEIGKRILMYYGQIIYILILMISVCSHTSDDRGIVALIDARPTNGICDITCLLCNRYNVSIRMKPQKNNQLHLENLIVNLNKSEQ